MRRSGRKSATPKSDNTALKIKLRGADATPLTMAELRECLLEVIRRLQEYEAGYHAKFPTLYFTMVDERGRPVRLNQANELTIFSYKSAAEEHGI